MISPRHFSLIVAAEISDGIGIHNQLPWQIKSEMAYFKKMTLFAPRGKRNAVVMGRKTYESLPEKFRPLPGRRNIVISKQPDYPHTGIDVVASFQSALTILAADTDIHRVFVIGGTQVFDTAILHHKLDAIYFTRVLTQINCTLFFPPIPPLFTLTQTSSAIPTPEEIPIQVEVWRRHD